MVEQTKDITPESDVIRNILTLRYNPSLSSILPKKSWTDFQETKNNFSSEYIENLIINSIKKSFPNSCPKNISIALSGGVDSTLVLTLLRKVFPKISINAFSIKFANSVDETQIAKTIAENFDANHTSIYLENYLSELPAAISVIGMPFWDLHWYYVVKNASKHSKYLASGDGGDELFGGYTFRYQKFLRIITSKSTKIDRIKAYLDCHERDRVPDQDFLFGPKVDFSWDKIYQILSPYFDNPLPPINQVFLADYNGKLLYNFSQVNSRIHDSFGMKSISPLLDSEITSLAPGMPLSIKYDSTSNIGKIILRTILKKYGSDKFVSNEKLGFNVNTLNLWKSHGYELCKNYLTNSRSVKDGWINQDWILKYLHKDDLDIKYVNKFLGLLALEIWYRLFVTKELSSNTKLT